MADGTGNLKKNVCDTDTTPFSWNLTQDGFVYVTEKDGWAST